MKVPGIGPSPADVMIVGEAPGAMEAEQGLPFIGSSGIEMTKMLVEAGFVRSECFITNVCKYRPPGNKVEQFFGKKGEGLPEVNGRYPRQQILEGLQELEDEIKAVRPKLIIAFGATALWALTGKEAIGDWRGSIMRHPSGAWIIPCYHPALILRQWAYRYITVSDLKRAQKLLAGKIFPPSYSFQVEPSYQIAVGAIYRLLEEADRSTKPPHISFDIETSRHQIACLGLAWSKSEAICLPFIDRRREDKSYWSLEEEVEIILLLRKLFSHPRIRFSGQNILYDIQYLARLWGIVPKIWRDTMIIHHTCLPGTPKSLDYLASLYLDWYEYWKHESQEWEKGIVEDALWVYNCKDCVITWEIAELQTAILEEMKFNSTPYGSPPKIQMSLIPVVFEAMLRGVKVDTELKRNLILILDVEVSKRQEWLNAVCGQPLNVRSPKQLQTFFYEDLGQKEIYNYKTGRRTTDEAALLKIAKREPLLGPIINCINEMRQLSAAQSFCVQPLEVDKRIRCSYNVSGTETFRFSSSEDAFGFGTNLQNITVGTETDKTKWEQENPGKAFEGMWIPNLRKMFIADPGYTFGEFDLKAADAQVVAAEAGEWELLEQLTNPTFDLHSINSSRWSLPRQTCKSAVHGTNYGATPKGLAVILGITVAIAEGLQRDWFTRYPGIKGWQDRVASDLQTRRYVENRFGYRRFYFDRVDESLFKEALAWIPQSTITVVTNLGIRKVVKEVPRVHFLLQNHDAAGFQWPSYLNQAPLIQAAMRIPIPYSNPLTIDVAYKTASNWGDCK